VPWGPNGPPDEAYERVTNPERFAELHELGDQLVASLVERFGAVVTPAELERCDRAVLVTPPVGGPLVIGWTDFPGLRVRVGNWSLSNAPQCGCDACDEDAASAWAEVMGVVDPFLAGDFTEDLQSQDYVAGSSRSSSQGVLLPAEVEKMLLVAPPGRYAWPAWSA
jgi:hypothetical protein